ncbi:MAG: UvrD-helicase domain-containing protein [Gallionella sp.]|jgi:ATP-dependent helicase/nuclease subunit A|nr:UvrD-helicase domain-containing protein [Gallionella sp.]
MDDAAALDPQNSVVVEACAGSGKTWLLVSRIVRLLLDDVRPGEILAITFTRKAAQEMQARLRDWLYELATRDDDFVRQFLIDRAIAAADLEAMLPKARGLYQQFLLAQPALTINTFHGWFMQIVQRAPLDAGMAGGVQLVEQTGALWDEASTLLFAGLHQRPDSEIAQSMRVLFAELGLFGTQKMLRAFAGKRSEWWAYTAGQADPLGYALENLRAELQVDLDADPYGELFAKRHFADDVRSLAAQLNASAAQKTRAERLLIPLDGTLPVDQCVALLWTELFTQKNEPRKITANKGQDVAAFDHAVELVREQVWGAYQKLQAQAIYRFNRHALRCGVALLDRYQQLKQQQQSLDFADLEWRVCQLLNHSPHAEYLQYKLDSRYRHVLLDEFQDTNPLQWQILQAWFAASAAVQSEPKIFVVGDPKQSIYRFRRADARLFGVVCEFLMGSYQAKYLQKNVTRRNAPAILQAVNAVFDGLSDGKPKFPGFETHGAYQTGLPGYVEILPLAQPEPAEKPGASGDSLTLRNPLLEAYPDREEGARELEAQAFAGKLSGIVGQWNIHADGGVRAVQWSDIMVLVRRRTHLKIYEQALRAQHIPYLTSRRGGLLDTLETRDCQALLTFLMAPFADLQLAHVLRSPMFSCSDAELMRIAESGLENSGSSNAARAGLVAGSEQQSGADNGVPRAVPLNPSWWSRLQHLAVTGDASAHLQRAHDLLQSWLVLAEKLPVHDLLDRIYFDADVQHRYAAAVPLAMRAKVLANLQAFMEIALNVDAGRYPSLSRFLRTLAELKQAEDNEAPDEGAVDQAGDALRIYTVHEAKGLEAPLVWLLDSNARAPADKGYDVLLDWPTHDVRPAHFSLYTDKASHGAAREKYFAADKELSEREDWNLLYVAMTRAKQVLLVSGSGALIPGTWYDRIANAHTEQADNPLLSERMSAQVRAKSSASFATDPRLTQPLPTGARKAVMTDAQRRGIWLHALLQHLTASTASGAENEREVLQQRCGIPASEMDVLWQQAQHLLAAPQLRRFFDARQYHSASNEMPYVNAAGELKRIDRLVEFDDEVWVLDYKLGSSEEPSRHQAQLREYQAAMRSVYAGKTVRCALLFADGKFSEI